VQAQPFIIVARAEPARYHYLRQLFGETMDVFIDRRVGERRRDPTPAGVERRRQDRRVRSLARDLQGIGWALVR